MRLLPASVFVLLLFPFVGAPSSWAQTTCTARCPNGTQSEPYSCDDSSYVPACLRTAPAANSNHLKPSAPSSGDPEVRRLNDQGIQAYTDGKFDDAIQYFQQALDKSPNDANILQNLQHAEDQLAAILKQKQELFEQDKQQALKVLEGVSGANSDSADSGSADSVKIPPPNPLDPSLKTLPERHYTPAGNGLILGLGAQVYARRAQGEPAQRMCQVIKQQAKGKNNDYSGEVDCNRYTFVLGMASSLDRFTDLRNRVAFDELTDGRFTTEEQRQYDKLRGKQFDELGCHSNGAMICLAALETQDIQATDVVLYGPQVTRESLGMWNQLMRDGRVKSIKVYINQNDPIPGVSIAYADFKKSQQASAEGLNTDPSVDDAIRQAAAANAVATADAGLLQIDTLIRTFNEVSPLLQVQSLPCKGEVLTAACHSLAIYKANVICAGKSSGDAVPDAEPLGKNGLPEPPTPCQAIGSARR